MRRASDDTKCVIVSVKCRSMAACLVCTEPITSSQLGVNACRACAAFFKRSVIAKRKYVCRQGDQQCPILLKDKFCCRSCRFQKCAELGMSYDSPQKRRLRKSNKSILDTVCDAYRESCIRRIEAEKIIVSKHKLKKLRNSQNYYKSTVISFWDVFRLLAKESEYLFREVLSGHCKEFAASKTSSFKSFISRFNMIENSYLSPLFLSWPNSALSLMQFIDCSNVETWLAKRSKEKRREDLESSFRGFTGDFADMIVPLRKLKEPVTEREFYALVALAIFEAVSDHSEECEETMWNLRSKVFVELHNYYRTELGLSDYSSRLGHLMTFFCNATEAGHLQRQEYRMYATMFNVLSDDPVLSDIFLS